MENVLVIKNLSKRFGSHQVIDDISLEIKSNTVLGFLGNNGAGKTTTMKMILGLMKPDAGEIYVCGEKVRYGDTKTNKNIGYLPDVPAFYSYLTPREYLRFCAEITSVSLPRSLKAGERTKNYKTSGICRTKQEGEQKD